MEDVYEQAKQLYNNNEHQQALSKALKAVKEDPQLIQDWLLIGSIQDLQAHHQEAIEAYQQVLRINENEAIVWKMVGMVFAKLYQHEQAIQHLHRSLALNSKDTLIYLELSKINIHIGKYDLALNYLNRGLRYDQNDIRIYKAKAKLFSVIDKYDLALRTYEIALKLYPNSGEIYRGMGGIHKKNSNTQDALKCYGKAISINPDDIAAYYKQGVIFSQQNLHYVASASFDKVLQLRPKHQLALNYYTSIQLEFQVIPAYKNYKKLRIPQKMAQYEKAKRYDIVDYFHAQFYTLSHFINGYLNLDLSKDNTYYQKIHAMAENAAYIYEINRHMDVTLIADFYEEIEELLQMDQSQIKEKLDKWIKTEFQKKHKLIELNKILAEQCLERSIAKSDFLYKGNRNFDSFSEYTIFCQEANQVGLSDAIDILIEILN